MTNWLEDVKRLEDERDVEAREKADVERLILAGTTEWVHTEVKPAMDRFAAELRSIGRVAEVRATETSCRVEVKDLAGIVPEFVAEVGTESAFSKEVRDRLPTMSAVFYGVDRDDVGEDRIYEHLKISYLSKIKSRSA